jgi:hypothetical protein
VEWATVDNGNKDPTERSGGQGWEWRGRGDITSRPRIGRIVEAAEDPRTSPSIDGARAWGDDGGGRVARPRSRLSARRWNGGAVSTYAMALHPRLAPAGEFGLEGSEAGQRGGTRPTCGEQGRRASRTPDRKGIVTTADGGDESATTQDRSGGRTGWCGRLRYSLKK